MMHFSSVEQIRLYSLSIGHHWFSPSTMRFFGSKIYPDIVGGRYFISSEKNFDSTQRLYTIRVVTDDGTIDTVGKFQGFTSLRQARKALNALEVAS